MTLDISSGGGADLATLGLRLDASSMVTGSRDANVALNTLATTAENTERKVVSLSALTRAGFDTIGASARSIGLDLAHVGVAFGAAFTSFEGIKKFVSETTDAQYATAQLEAAIRSTGGAAGKSAEQLEAYAKSVERTSTFSDDAVEKAQSILLTFDKIKGVQFDETTQAVADLASRMGGDLTGAALQLGKALQDPDQGLLALRREGVSFSQSQQQVIKDLFDTGKEAEAQELILKELQHEFGGAAQAARDTFGGSLRGLKNDFGDLFKASSGGTSTLVSGINLLDAGVVALKPHMGELVAVAGTVGAVFAGRWISGGVDQLTGLTKALIVGRAEAAAYAENAVRVAAAQVESTAVTVEQATVERGLAAERVQSAIADQLALQERAAALNALIAADERLVVANEAAAASEVALTEATAATTVAATAATAAEGLFTGALALIGGVPGAVALATIGLITYAIHLHGDETRRVKDDVDLYTGSLSKLTLEELKNQQATLQAAKAQEEAARARLQAQRNALPTGGADPLSGYGADQRAEDLDRGIATASASISAFDGMLLAGSNAIAGAQKTETDAVTKLTTQRTAELDKLKALNSAYGESDYAIKLLTISKDAEIKKSEDAKDHHGAELKALDDLTDAMTREQRIAATNALIKAQTIDLNAYTAANAALVQAAENEYHLATATNAAKVADQAAADASTHRWDTIAIGTTSTAALVARTAEATAADVAATAAARARAVEIEHTKVAQDAEAQSTAALVTYQAETVGATKLEIDAAQKKYDARVVAIGQEKDWKDAQVDATAATDAQADTERRAAANTAFADHVAANVDALNRETANLYAEAAAKREGQAAVDALAVRLAGEAAVRAALNQAVQAHVDLTQAEIDATRTAAEAHERAAQALSHASQEEKAYADVSKNFVRGIQGDVGTFFENVFDGGINAAEKFWESFKSLALKAFGELAAKDLMQTVIAGTHGQGALGGLLGGLGGGANASSPAQQFVTGGVSFVGDGGAGAGASSLGTFSLAAAGVIGVTSALNDLLHTTPPTIDSIKKLVESVIALDKSIADYQLSVTGSSVAQALAQNKNTADQLRQQTESDLAGKKLQGPREQRLGEIDQTEAAGAQKIAADFWQSIGDQITALSGPAAQYAAKIGSIETAYAQNVGAADALAKAEGRAGISDDERAKLLDLETKALVAAAAAEAERLTQLQASLDAREAAAKGDSAVADAITRRAAEDKELFDAQQAGYTDAQIAQLKYIQGLEDEAAAKKKLTSAQNDLASNLAAGAGGTLSQQQAAALQPLLDQYAADQKNYNDAVAAGIDPVTELALQTQVAADAAAIAAKQFQNAAAALEQSASDIEDAVSGGYLSGSAGLAQERSGIASLTGVDVGSLSNDAAIRALYTVPGQGQELTDQQRETNKLIDKYFADEAQWGPQLATAASTLASGGASSASSASTSAVASGAKGLTDQVGNRMADYLSTLIVRTTEIRDDQRIFHGGRLGSAYAFPAVTATGPAPSFAGQQPNAGAAAQHVDVTINHRIELRASADAKTSARDVVREVLAALQDPDVRKALAKADNEIIGQIIIAKNRDQGNNLVGSIGLGLGN